MILSNTIRQQVYERAEGRCEYCRIPDENGYAPQEIDHIYAIQHGGTSNMDNLCLACWICNRYKGTNLSSLDPLTGEVVRLFHPRRDVWLEHFRLIGAKIEALTPVGRVTVNLLQLNRNDRLEERRIMITLGIL